MADQILPAIAIIATLIMGSPGAEPIDRGLYYGSNVALMGDWMQTRHIANNPDDFHENNRLLGGHPSRSKVDNYFMASWLLNQTVIRSMGYKKRRLYQGGMLALELKMIDQNLGLGIKYDF